MLPLTDYYAHPLGRLGKQSQCKSCQKARSSAWGRENKHVRKARIYEADPLLIDRLLDVPTCQACGVAFTDFGKERLDHCHEHGHMRGVLCHKCNITCQGTAAEATDRMRACLAYLERDLQWQALGGSCQS